MIMEYLFDVILERFGAESKEVFSAGSEECPQLTGDEKLVVFRNPLDRSEADLYLFFMKSKYTLIFGNWSGHFLMTPQDETRLLYALDLILNKQAHVLSVESPSFIISVLCQDQKIFFSSEASSSVVQMFRNKAFMEEVAKGQFEFSDMYWDKKV